MCVPLVMIVLTLAQAPARMPRRPPAPAPAPHHAAAARDALAIQVMLDRAGFSPGVIDGRPGSNTDKALALYTQTGGDASAIPADAVVRYTITREVASGPYAPDIPADLMAQSKLPALA